MKKFWNLMLAALVIFGAVACTEKEVAPEQNAGMSIYATINAEQTRVDVVQDENYDTNKKWNTIWTAGDTLEVFSFDDNTFFYFENSADNVNKFTCNEPGVNDLIGDYVLVSVVTNTENCSTSYNSTKGKQGAEINVYIDNFDPANTINLETLTAFLRYSSNYEITLEASDDIFYDKDDNNVNTITLPASEEDVWVAVWPCENITFSYTIDDVKCKETTTTFEAGKIYNLGALEPVAEPEMTTVYLVPGAWASDNAHFAVYYWIGENSTDTLMTKHATKDGVYEVKVAANADGLLFKRLEPEAHSVWNQTVDLTLPTEADKNYFYFETWDNGDGKSTGRWDVDPFAPETPDQASNWCVTGVFCSWSAAGTGMVTTTVKNLFVAKNITLAAYSDEFKIKLKSTWDGSIGAGAINYINKNSKVVGYADSSINFSAVEAGKYDIYFDALTNNVYLMVAGTDYSTAATQDKNGPMPDMSSVTWGLCGAHNGWGDDDPLAWDGTIGMYVAKSVKLNGEFKVRADKAWTTSFGNGGTITVNKAAATIVYNNGGNCKVASGTYDVYFWYDTTNIKANGKIWVKTAGSAAPSL